MKIHRHFALAGGALLLAVMLCGGCSLLRDTPPPPPQVPERWLTSPQAATPGYREFWSAFNEPDLMTLQARALRQNNSLKLSALSLKLYRIQADLSRLNLSPDAALSATAGTSRPLTTENGIAPAISRSAGASASLIWQPDIWGQYGASAEAAALDAQAGEADWRAARLTLLAAVAQAHWQTGLLNRVRTDNLHNLEVARETLHLAEVRHQAGATDMADVLLARQRVSEAQGTLSQTEQQLAAARTTLTQLTGDTPETHLPELQAVPDTPLPLPAAGLPVSLLARRPDVRAAELRVRSSVARADATRLSFYPAFSLTGSVGTASQTLTNYLSNPVGSLALSLSLPFIQFRTARLSNEAAGVNAQMAAVQFRQTLYAALQQVENALSDRTHLDEQAGWLRLQLTQAQESERLSQARWLAGATDIQPLLDAQTARQQTELSLMQNNLQRRSNAAALYVALGGDYTAE
ncbi:efflux transporter outer membrane subunit [Erwinia psidii]|uniref:efflux transporter outer membrane subunit n=1 Tax=Erwinia psidii TaxID=69224 RepID=UPI00226B55DC|nr:efflux transporter outer membrane subunit [Erwinia psidii]MCX8959614.1 efflux transporter outer membrane subunit [Erwinia psidii]MCX8964557.1 efflux transporter outer membrane subunit [Erwinia psidii]